MTESILIAAGVGAFFSILRFSIDLLIDLSQRVSTEVSDFKKDSTVPSAAAASASNDKSNPLKEKEPRKDLGKPSTSSWARSSSQFRRTVFIEGRFSISHFTRRSSINNVNPDVDVEANGTTPVSSSIIKSTTAEQEQTTEEDEIKTRKNQSLAWRLTIVSGFIHVMLFVYFLVATILSTQPSHHSFHSSVFNSLELGGVTVGLFFSILTVLRKDTSRRFNTFQRFYYWTSGLIYFLACIVALAMSPPETPTDVDKISMAALTLYFVWVSLEILLCPTPSALRLPSETMSQNKAHLSKKAIMIILKPYFWPQSTPENSAYINRILALSTWGCVAGSKVCSLISPIILGKASTALTRLDYWTAARLVIIYCVLQFFSNVLKEGQSLVYLTVAKAAFIQLSETSFGHLHSLSLDWHLRKKLGEVLRSMDRGIQACDTLMRYLFLYMIPALAECVLVVIIFASYFHYLPIAVSVFLFVYAYVMVTIILTVWRKKFRYSVAKSDNDWHDKATDSLVNFEIVKFFTAEDYEMEKFKTSITKFQSGNVNIQASLSFLNLSQNLLMQACLATGLVLSIYGIRKRNTCCVSRGCLSGLSECCSALEPRCPGMEIGDWVTVLTYTINLFVPLNFLGSVYNAIIMALIDLRNLSELLAENPDIIDSPNSIELPTENTIEPDIAVEFDNVSFHYATQPESKGLKGVSFKLKRGTTTGLVGTTGAGKTTISRLLFRFYDTLDGSVKVNGVDVRKVTQRSLRTAIGVVPQATSLFNDTIKENILYGKRDATEEDLERVSKAAQLYNFVQSLPEQFETVVGDRGLKLSGGEKQRVAIARCLLKDPPLVVLDEATSALDTVTENSVQEALDALGSRRTCLVIAHRLGTIRNADNIIVMGDGCVLEQGTHDELLALNGKYAEMWNMQLHSTRASLTNLTELDNNN